MKYKAGDVVRIQPKEWIDAQEKNAAGGIMKTRIVVVPDMFQYAGRTAKITAVLSDDIYRLDMDNGEWRWPEWVFDHDYTSNEPLSAEDAIRAMLDGETLHRGYKVIEKWNGTHFVYQILGNQEWHLKPQDGVFTGLYSRPLKRNRTMTQWEALAWASSADSFGWVIRKSCNYEWSPPQFYSYIDLIGYQRARLLPDGSGIDESTIQGFEVEEE